MILSYQTDAYGALVGVGFLEDYITEPTDGNNGFIDQKIRFSNKCGVSFQYLMELTKYI